MDIVIFGISGHLAEKKLIPVLSHLYEKGALPVDTHVIGFSRGVKQFDLPLGYSYIHIAGHYGNVEDFLKLKEMLRPEKKQLFYLALPPEAARATLVSISTAGLVTKKDPSGTRTILVEKPFGTGLTDARSLIDFINESFLPEQCLKVDHYVGKKELRNLDRATIESEIPYIKKVIFEIIETATIENRSGFYDSVGALRDVGQNHLLLMLALFFGGQKNREEIFSCLTIDPDTSKYQFGCYEGYDKIETFFSIPALLQQSDSSLISPEIILRSGKGLSKNKSRISIEYVDGNKKETILIPGGDAYEHILLDAINGSSKSFLSDHEVLSAWAFIENVERIKDNILKNGAFFSYPVGSDAEHFL